MLCKIERQFSGRASGGCVARFRDRGQRPRRGSTTLPAGSRLKGSCFQVMKCGERALLDAWMAAREDLVEFAVSLGLVLECAMRRRSVGAIYTTLGRLEPKGLVESRMTERLGRRRHHHQSQARMITPRTPPRPPSVWARRSAPSRSSATRSSRLLRVRSSA